MPDDTTLSDAARLLSPQLLQDTRSDTARVWTTQALCVGADPEAFFPPGDGPAAEARAICAASQSVKSVPNWTWSHISTRGPNHAFLRAYVVLLNCKHCPVITARLHSRLAYRPRQQKLQPANLSPVRTLAFEPLGHLPISISEMAN